MENWDKPVLAWLDGRVAAMHQLGVVELVRSHARAAWLRNIDDYDETLGDTARSLGVAQSENLRVRTLRAYRDNRVSWALKGVEVTEPQQSLLISAAGLFIHPMKSRNNRQQEPAWSSWRWSEASHVRLEAARYNRARYKPDLSGGQQALPGLDKEFFGDPSVLAHLALVYAGDQRTGRTAGWAAVPSADKDGKESREPWMAVVRLWWDENSADGQGVRPETSTPSDHEAFDTRPTPTATVSMKPSRRKPTQ